MISLHNVEKRYPDGTIAVHGLSLEAPTGKLTVLVGPSGCGKTTTLRMINRLIPLSSGRIELDGTDTSHLKDVELRRQIGYVIQNAGLFPHRTALDNVAALPILLGAKRRSARAAAMELLERVGLNESHAHRYPWQLSGGQQQRVGVARALATDPPYLLMDEPFSAVDPIMRAQLQDEFLRLQREIGKTIVMVTHDIDEALKLGDQVAVLRAGGRLAQLAPPAELLSHPADAFVAGFVGRDRGYRALGFAASGELPLVPEPTVAIGSDLSGVPGRAVDGWALVVDADRKPLGWLAVGGLEPAQLTGPVTPELLNLGGTLATQQGTLREVLDAALSSPSGRGVVVDDDGAFLGTITASEVLARIESRASSLRREAVEAAAVEVMTKS